MSRASFQCICLSNAWLGNKASLCVLASQFLATFINATAKYLESNDDEVINPLQILQGRMIVTAVMCTLTLHLLATDASEALHTLPSAYRLQGLLALRATAGTCGVVGFYYSLVYLPLTEATSLNLLAPLLACCIIGIVDNAVLHTNEMIAAFSCLLGALAIVKPAFVFGSEDNVGGKNRAIGAAFAIMGATGASVSYVCVRKIGTDLHPILVVKCFAISVLCITSVIQLATIKREDVIKLNIGSLDWALIVLMGALGFAMECLLSLGLSLDPTSRATQTIYIQSILSLVLDLVVSRSLPDLWSMFGCAVVLLSNISITKRKQPKIGLPYLSDCEGGFELLVATPT